MQVPASALTLVDIHCRQQIWSVLQIVLMMYVGPEWQQEQTYPNACQLAVPDFFYLFWDMSVLKLSIGLQRQILLYTHVV